MQDQASNMVPRNEEGNPAGAHESELESVKQELAKWQERVPKLAAALKKRTSEVEKLKAGQPAAAKGEAFSDAGVKVRDELIAELEAKVKDLTTRHHDLQGELHARALVSKDLEADVASWKDKWHSVTQSLDTLSQLVAAKKEELEHMRQSSERALADGEHSLADLQTECDDLKSRNAKLNETTELANGQIELLGDNLNNLREQLRGKDVRISELSGSEKDVSREIEALQTRANDFEARALQGEQQAAKIKAEFESVEAAVAEKTATRSRLEQENEQLTRDQDDLLAQIQTLKETHESALTQLREDFSKERDAERERQVQALEARNVEQQEAQARALEALEQRLAGEHENAVAESVERLRELEAELDKKDEDWTGHLAKKEREFEERLHANDALEHMVKEKQNEIERLLGERQHHAGEVERLEEVVGHAEEAVDHREDERRQLSESLAEAESRAQRVEAQLKERSEFAVALEEEKQHLAAMLEGAKNENEVVLEGKHKAERHAGEHDEHIAQLDDRLERQKELMQQIEVELSDARDDLETQTRDSREQLAAKEAELADLREELAVHLQRLEEQAPEFERSTFVTEPSPEADDDATQPDHEAPADNERLVKQLNSLETSGAPVGSPSDDLTKINGIGTKLAEQLRELGYASFTSIAELNVDDIESQDHPLYPYRTRVGRDEWIEQAATLAC